MKKITSSYNEIIALVFLIVSNIILSINFGKISIFIFATFFNLSLLYVGNKVKFKNKCFIIAVTLISYILMYLIYFGYFQQYGAPYYYGGSDDFKFEQLAESFALNNIYNYEQMNNILLYEYNHYVGNGFIYLLTMFIQMCNSIDGYHTILFRIFNIHCLILGSILLIKTFTIYNKEDNKLQNRIEKFLFPIVLFPSTIYISSHVFRDTIVFLLFSLVLYFIFSKSKYWLLKIAVIIPIMFLLRPEFCAVLLILVLCVYYKKQNNKLIRNLLIFVMFIVIIIAIEELNFISLAYHKITLYAAYLSDGSGLGNRIFNIPLFPYGIVIRILYALISPLPHLVFVDDLYFENFLQAFRALGTWYFIFLLPYWIRSLMEKSILANISLASLIMVCATTFTFRHFILFFPIAILAALIQKNKTSDYDAKKYFIISGSLIFLYLLLYYFVFKL